MGRSLLFHTNRYKQINKNELQGHADFEVMKVFANKGENFNEWLNAEYIQPLLNETYTNIFVPLSPNYAISDFMGLLVAMHIRCSPSKCQNANIFIYGFSDHKDLLKNQFFDILKTAGVYLIDYSLQEIVRYARTEKVALKMEDLPAELNKINLKVPANFYDNHSIANVWGMHRLLEIEGVDKNEIEGLKGNELMDTIYFKWLAAKNMLSEEIVEDAIEETKKYRVTIKINPVKYKIDLDSL